MANNKKKILYISFFLILLLTISLLTGCGKSATASKDGTSLALTMEEIEKDNRNGIFVLNKNKTFSPVISDLPGFAGETAEAANDRYVWFTDNSTDISSLIPVATPGTPLVAIYDSTKDMPAVWYLEKYEDKGYTIGAHIFLDEDNTMLIQAADTLSGTSAENELGAASGSDDSYEISEISGSPVLPIDNIDNNMGILLGTQANKLYTIKFYRGTKETVTDIYADARIFQSSKYVEMKNPFKKTSQGYFIINLPMNLEDGYYYLADLGFFRYKAK